MPPVDSDTIALNRVYRPGDLRTGTWRALADARCRVRVIPTVGLEQAYRPVAGLLTFSLRADDRVVFGPGCPLAWQVA